MRRPGLFIPVVLLATGCVEAKDALLPELKGRWATEHAARIRMAATGDTRAPQGLQELCRTDYVAFDKRAITLHSAGKANPFFVAREVKREGRRIIFTGGVPVLGSSESRLEIMLYDGEIRFDDISNERGRSLRYQRFENPSAREIGVKTIGDVFRLTFDLKQCKA